MPLLCLPMPILWPTCYIISTNSNLEIKIVQKLGFIEVWHTISLISLVHYHNQSEAVPTYVPLCHILPLWYLITIMYPIFFCLHAPCPIPLFPYTSTTSMPQNMSPLPMYAPVMILFCLAPNHGQSNGSMLPLPLNFSAIMCN